MKYKHRCADCGSTERFYTVAHVTQEWVVDEFGNFILATSSCDEVIAGPNNNNTWQCAKCYSTNIEHIEMEDR